MVGDFRRQDVLTELTGEIVRSYRELPIIERLGEGPLPSAQAIVEIATDLKEIIFPGYQQRRDLGWQNVTERLAEFLDRLYGRLAEEIECALRHDAKSVDGREQNDRNHEAFGSQARDKVNAFLKSLPRIRRLVATDVQAAFDGDPAARSADEIICCYPGLDAITVYRLAHELHSLGVPLVPRMMTEWAHSRTGIDIHPGARIGPGFFIDHGTGVVIGETCEIADHVKLYQGVTLGALSFQTDADGNLVRGTKRHPTIERKVVVYANATILGGLTVVGAHSVIGAGVSITRSVSPNTVVTLEKPSLRFREAS